MINILNSNLIYIHVLQRQRILSFECALKLSLINVLCNILTCLLLSLFVIEIWMRNNDCKISFDSYYVNYNSENIF